MCYGRPLRVALGPDEPRLGTFVHGGQADGVSVKAGGQGRSSAVIEAGAPAGAGVPSNRDLDRPGQRVPSTTRFSGRPVSRYEITLVTERRLSSSSESRE